MIGEIHVIDNRLLPNSRRDDFEDNDLRDQLHESFVRQVGIPYSRKIRKLSTERSKQKMIEDSNLIVRRARKIMEGGYIAQAQKRDVVAKLREIKNICPRGMADQDNDLLLATVKHSKHALTKIDGLLPNRTKVMLERVFEIIYRESDNKMKTENLLEEVLSQLL